MLKDSEIVPLNLGRMNFNVRSRKRARVALAVLRGQ